MNEFLSWLAKQIGLTIPILMATTLPHGNAQFDESPYIVYKRNESISVVAKQIGLSLPIQMTTIATT